MPQVTLDQIALGAIESLVRKHKPELVPIWENGLGALTHGLLVAGGVPQYGGDELAARILACCGVRRRRPPMNPASGPGRDRVIDVTGGPA